VLYPCVVEALSGIEDPLGIARRTSRCGRRNPRDHPGFGRGWVGSYTAMVQQGEPASVENWEPSLVSGRVPPGPPRPPAPPTTGGGGGEEHESRPRLTSRERVILIELCRPLMAGGTDAAPATPREIADVMGVGEAAVNVYVSRLFEKLGVSGSRSDLARRAIETGAV